MLRRLLGALWPSKPVEQAATEQAGIASGRTSERGLRATPENSTRYRYLAYWPDYTLRGTILEIRDMDRRDGRIKKMHTRTARAAIKGGLVLNAPSSLTVLHREWKAFERRLQLHRREKLESDLRGLMMEGNLPLQWVLDDTTRVVGGIRMPTETLKALVGPNGRFLDPRQAYEQWDLAEGRAVATFPAWALSIVRLTPDNYDDMGAFGRPYFDAGREVWQRLAMTEEDMVIRRHDRAPQHLFHSLEGATKDELEVYKAEVEDDRKNGINRDFYANKKGSVSAVQGDVNLDQIADVVHLLDTFFAGGPAPKGLFGYDSNLNRDILEELRRDWYDEIDALQDQVAYVYELGFKLDLLLQGVNPDNFDFSVEFAERRSETPTQATDRALKEMALGLPAEVYWRTAGYEPARVREMKEDEAQEFDPYPGEDEHEPEEGGTAGPAAPAPVMPRLRPRVSIVPGNAKGGDSATYVAKS